MGPVPRKRPRMARNLGNLKWNSIPEEMQQMIVDKMDRKTNCKFMRCSKKSENQARRSPDYLYSYEIREDETSKKKMLLLSFTKHSMTRYWYEFAEVQGEPNRTVVMYKYNSPENAMKSVTKWVELVDGSPEENRLKYIQKHIQSYKYSIKLFKINDSNVPIEKFDVRELKCLKKLMFHFEFPEISEEKMNNFADIKKLQNISNLQALSLIFTFEQVVNFNGKKLVIRSAEFNLENMSKYLIMLQMEDIVINELSVIRSVRDQFALRDLTKNLRFSNYVEEKDYEEDETTSSCTFTLNSLNGRKYSVTLSKYSFEIYVMK
ncbi:unnamed protein product [Caenorhabditis angaria]|uniref:F-box domain-containing protein n=1 Tax=Caenorhabditis angaria TaxID=860376 RepID=A0A9P1I7Z7_9PELO|nr:unnamed protein product [Caenorhabditis angaria]